MIDLSSRAALVFFLFGRAAVAQGFDDYPFLGNWTCGGATYSFTVDTFNDGEQNYAIKTITEGLHDFRIVLTSDNEVEIAALTDTTMTLSSSAKSENFVCSRLP